MKKHGFTLIEMLVVIAIIGLLSAILIPAVGKGLASSKKRRADMEIQALKTAIEQFYDDHHYMPYWKSEKDSKLGDDVDSSGDAGIHDIVMQILTGSNVLKKAYITFKSTDGFDDYRFKDPWKQDYVVILDRNNDGITEYAGEKVRQKVLVYSEGPPNGDPIYSWRKVLKND